MTAAYEIDGPLPGEPCTAEAWTAVPRSSRSVPDSNQVGLVAKKRPK